MKVAIWGSYNYGNYGDDIMAIQFAIHLQKLGVEPIVYRLDRDLAVRYGLKTTDSLDELLSQAKFCIIGGGGFLVENFPPDAEEDFRCLHLASIKHQCRVYPISIGGSGYGESARLSYWRSQFFGGDMCQWCSVRLESDVALIHRLGKPAVYYPDILLSVAEFWQIAPQNKYNSNSSPTLHVGINIPNTLQCRWFAFQLSLIAAIRKDIVFHFIRTYLPSSDVNTELLPKWNSKQHHVYTDPRTTLEFLASLDLVVSYKLHLGLTAIALGVPFYSLGGSGKAKAFLNSINADAVWKPGDKRFKLAAFLANPDNIRSSRQNFDFTLVDKLTKSSWGHLARLDKLVTGSLS